MSETKLLIIIIALFFAYLFEAFAHNLEGCLRYGVILEHASKVVDIRLIWYAS